jgi:hypothetical protein
MKSVEEGKYIGGCPPYGYDYNKLTQQLEVNEQESEIVKTIFDLYVNQDLGDMKIATMMRDLNIKTKHNKTWDKTTVRKIITNPIYIGKTRWGKTSSKLPLKEYDGKHEAIISEDIYNKAQELTKNRYIPRVKDSYQERNPLSGLIKCTCGRTMSLRTAKGQPDSMRCPINCGNKGTYRYVIENKLIVILHNQLKEMHSEFQYKKQPNKKDNYSALINSNKNELIKAIEQRNKLFDLLEQGIYDNKTFLARMNVLSDKISLLEKTITDMEIEQNDFKSSLFKADRIPIIEKSIHFIEHFYWNSEAKDKNEFLHQVVKYANFTKNEKGLELFKLEVFLKL